MFNSLRNLLSWLSARGIIFLIPFIATSYVLQAHLSYDNLYNSILDLADGYIPSFIDQAQLSDFYVDNSGAIDELYVQCISFGFESPPELQQLQLPCMNCESLENYSSGAECAEAAKAEIDGINSTKEFLNLYAKFCASIEISDTEIPCLSCKSLLSHPEPFSCVNQTLYSAYYEDDNLKIISETERTLRKALSYSSLLFVLFLISAYIFSTDRLETTKLVSKSVMFGGIIGVVSSYFILKGAPTILNEVVAQYTGPQIIGAIKPIIDVIVLSPLSTLVYVQFIMFVIGLLSYFGVEIYSRKNK